MNNISILIGNVLFICISAVFMPVCAQTKVTLDKKPRVESFKPTDSAIGTTKYTEAELNRYQQHLSQAYQALLSDSLLRATDEFTQATDLLPNHPSNAEAFFQLGQIAEQREQYRQAADYYRKSVRINENLAKAYSRKGAMNIILKDYDTALRDYSNYISLRPKDYDARIYRGHAYQQLRRFGEAQADYQYILNADPFNAKATMAMATLDLDRGNAEEALATMDKLILRFPDNATYYELRGEIDMELRRLELASYDFNKAIELEPDNAAHYLKRAALYFRQSNGPLAQADLDKAATLGASKEQINAVIYKANSDKRIKQ